MPSSRVLCTPNKPTTILVGMYEAGCTALTVTFCPSSSRAMSTGEHDLRELGLAISLNAVPVAFQQRIIEVDGCLARRSYVDDARGRRRLEQRQQQPAEH